MLQAHPCVQTLPEALGRQPQLPERGRMHSWLLRLLSHHTGYFFLVALAKSGDLPCPCRATWQLLRSLVRASRRGTLLALGLE